MTSLTVALFVGYVSLILMLLILMEHAHDDIRFGVCGDLYHGRRNPNRWRLPLAARVLCWARRLAWPSIGLRWPTRSWSWDHWAQGLPSSP